MSIKHNRLIFKIVLSGLVLVGGTARLASNSQAGEAAPAVSRPALTVRTTTLHEENRNEDV